MKIAFKNFLMTLRRYKVASLLNVLGLTLAFVAFYIIFSQVWFTLTYNHSLKDADRTYLISPDFGGGGTLLSEALSFPSPSAYYNLQQKKLQLLPYKQVQFSSQKEESVVP